MRQSAFLVAALLIPVFVLGQCVEPTNSMNIESSAVFCLGIYLLPDGIKVSEDSVILDCNNAIIKGSFAGSGITVKASNATVKNCIIQDYEDAIYLVSSKGNSIVNNSFLPKRYAVKLINSYENMIVGNSITENADMTGDVIGAINSKFNIFRFNGIYLEGKGFCLDNACDTITEIPHCINNDNYCPDSCSAINDTDCLIEEKDEPTGTQTTDVTTVDTQISEEEILIKALRLKNANASEQEIERLLSGYLLIQNDSLVIKRDFYFDNESKSTIVSITLTPKKPLSNLTLLEYIPKCFSEYLSDIKFNKKDFEVIDEDPIIIWDNINIGNGKKIQYSSNTQISDRCRELFNMFGITPKKEERKEEFNILFAVFASLAIIIAIIAITIKSSHKSKLK